MINQEGDDKLVETDSEEVKEVFEYLAKKREGQWNEYAKEKMKARVEE